jgi:hypothetical protein
MEGFVKGFLIFLFVVLIAVGGFGFYRGWWSVSSEKGADNKVHFGLTVDKEKISADEQAALKKVKPGAQPAPDKVAGTVEKAKTTTEEAAAAAEKTAKDAAVKATQDAKDAVKLPVALPQPKK